MFVLSEPLNYFYCKNEDEEKSISMMNLKFVAWQKQAQTLMEHSG